MDLKRLMDDADAETVAQYIGLSIQKKGNRSYILCPGHRIRLGKDDRKLGNCVLTAHGYRCFACNETVGLAQMVMEHTGCSKGEAFVTIAEAMGGVSLYEESNNDSWQHRGPAERLSQEELDALEIRTGYNCSISSGTTVVREGLTVLYEKNSALYRELLLERAEHQLQKYEDLLTRFGTPEAKGSHEIFRLLGNKYQPTVFEDLRSEASRRVEIIKGAIAKLSHQAVV